jgi:hypothetical protein
VKFLQWEEEFLGAMSHTIETMMISSIGTALSPPLVWERKI